MTGLQLLLAGSWLLLAGSGLLLAGSEYIWLLLTGFKLLLAASELLLAGRPSGSYSRPDSYLVDPASSHMLVSKIKPCMSKYKPH